MNAEFNWWLLIVGLVVGAGLVWLVIADWSRREEDLSDDERVAESGWIAQTLRERGDSIDPEAAEEILALHRAYLRATGLLEQSDADEALDSDAEDAWATEAPAGTEWPSTEGNRPRDSDAVPTQRAAGEVNPAGASSADPAEDARSSGGSAPNPGGTSATNISGRPSVRAAPLSPRGGRGHGLESEPPA